ncbi:MAG: hypothetical protein OP8BY_1314 [Candidatus Saccharicenans subterraneus]|uniref:Uncharacterized protein n=1 Tax=Candidatus Saccharicenans subterraneus TaxID=2508984 RepID=A0A3E2BPS1_9BACT|nr:MAG: hypothetical protein OP8BY_1314 [Candidatus Saccharicenans subterraneum]
MLPGYQQPLYCPLAPWVPGDRRGYSSEPIPAFSVLTAIDKRKKGAIIIG